MNEPKERYVKKQKLGAGGMGEVWLAVDTLLDREVAIKYLLQVKDPSLREQFLAEARILASLNHPAITTIFDVVLDEDTVYLVMEYVQGTSLSEWIETKGQLSLNDALTVTIAVLEALHYAHKQGVIHRDIKPSNILLLGHLGEGQIKLLDFGIAGLVSQLLQEGDTLFGTIAYMSPEQIERLPADGRSDLYSLGVTLYEMLAGGHYPFGVRDDDSMMWAHLSERPTSIRKHLPTVPAQLERIIDRMLAKYPEERFQIAGALIPVLTSIRARHRYSQPYLQLQNKDSRQLIGRVSELQKMRQVWLQTLEHNNPHLLLVKGDIGMGKSELVAEFLGTHIIDESFAAIVGRCDEMGIPYKPFADILATIFANELLPRPESEAEIAILVRQMPQMNRILRPSKPLDQLAEEEVLLPDDPEHGSTAMQGTLQRAQWQFFDLVLGYFATLSPMAIFIDDAHFLDESSLALIQYLLRNGQQLPVLIITAAQDRPDALRWAHKLQATEKSIIMVQPLGTASVKAYLSKLLNGPVGNEIALYLQKRSEGNLYYLREIVQHLLGSGHIFQELNGSWHYKVEDAVALPPSLVYLFEEEIGKLTPASHDALVTAAVIGSEFYFSVWLLLLGGQEKLSIALDAIDEALAMRLLRQSGQDRYMFNPAMLQNVLLDTLNPSRRRYLHKKTTGILEKVTTNPAIIAHHAQAAGLTEKAARYYEIAGSQAMIANALKQAIYYFETAVELLPAQRVYEMLGNLYRQLGISTKAITNLRHAYEMAREKRDLKAQARILNGLAFVYWIYDQYPEAYQCAKGALNLPGINESEKANAQSHLGMISWLAGRLPEAESWCDLALETLAKTNDKASLAGCYSRLGLVKFSQSRMNAAAEAFQKSADLRREIDDHWGLAYALNGLGKVASAQGDFPRAFSYFDAAHALFEKISSRDGLMVVYNNQGQTMMRQGDPEAALPLLLKAYHFGRKINKQSAYGLGEICLNLAEANCQLGDLATAQTAIEQGEKIVKAAGNKEYIALAQLVRAAIYQAQGENELAAEAYHQARDWYVQLGNLGGMLRAQLQYARFLQLQGEDEEASQLERAARLQAAKLGLHL